MNNDPMITTHRRGLMAVAVASLLLGGSGFVRAAVVGQWDFENGNLAATVGPALDYNDGGGGATQQRTRFGTTTSLGLPDIGGQPARVMGFDAFTNPEGYTLPTPGSGNGGGELINQYTLIMDVYYPPSSDKKWRALIEIDGGLTADSDLFINTSNGIGISGQYAGQVTTNQWHRIAFTVDQSAEANQIRKYIDGALVGTQAAGGLEGRWALTPSAWAVLFTDNDGEVAPGYVNSLQLRDEVLTTAQLAALGGAQAAGIPQQLPAVPSYVETWIPAGEYGSTTTDVGVVVNGGDSTLTGWTLSLDGTDKTPVVTQDGTVYTVKVTSQNFTPLSDHTVIITYVDSATGSKSLSHSFRVPVLFEDFDHLTLLPAKDDAANDRAWTHTPPSGWSIDNRDFVATLISADNPDADGDGYADGDGITEFAGWSFVNKDWWVAKDNQTRDQFTLGKNIVAVADPDEWDDTSHAVSLFFSYFKTPEISLTGLSPDTLFLQFSSSWRPEGLDDANPSKFPVGPNGEAINNQTAIVTVKFDNAAPIQLLKWDSKDGSPTFKPDSQNETITLSLNNPPGAQKAVISFEMHEAANDWWWAIDNVLLDAGAAPPILTAQPAKAIVTAGQPASMSVTASGSGPISYQWYRLVNGVKVPVPGATTDTLQIAVATLADNGPYLAEVSNSAGKTTSNNALLTVLPGPTATVQFSEDFEGVPLGAPVDETAPATGPVWTKTPPQGWTIDDTGVPGVGDPATDGVTEWAGWSFAQREWWASVDDQRRSQFTTGTNVVAIADSDEYDDQSHPAGTYNTYLSTPSISLAGAGANTAYLVFSSSWRPEPNQVANITATYDNGAPVEVLRFESNPASPSYKDDNSTADRLVVPLANPAGAQRLMLTFGYFDAANNWWWAIDNILVVTDTSGGIGTTLYASRVANGRVKIEWTGGGTLQSAATINGPWADGTGVTSPHETATEGEARFFRVKQ
ncbi:MAG: hypothetical protein HS113_04120 [Verrucomicrobiales bacterium]|nr:hypothetical protein [Verrucomicrobiales bacterium]